MLSRASSDAGTRLRRSKSTSTVPSHRAPAPEPWDPDVAQQHAIAAATAAFVRAQGQEAAERSKKRSSELSRAKSNASRKSQGSHFPPREPSIRSIPPQKPAQMLGVSRQTRAAPVTAMEKFQPFQVTPSTGKSGSSPTSNENMRPSSQPKPRVSASSSVTSQQIRKARSMYYASSVQTGSPIARPPAKYLTTPPISPPPDSALLLARSQDGYFQRPRSAAISTRASTRLPTSTAPNEVIDKARDRCLQDFQQRRQVKNKPSLFLAPFRKRQDKAKTKVPPLPGGAVSYDSHRLPTRSTANVASIELKPLKEKRSISDSLRNRFRKVFRRSSHKSTTLPVQQIEASRDYFCDPSAQEVSAEPMKRPLGTPSPDEETLQRFRSRSPSFEGARAALARPSSRGSNHSVRSEASLTNTTSRVTSWANSSASGTLTQKEMKRLTVIHEAKNSISSEVGHQYIPPSPVRKPPAPPGFSASRDPMPMDSVVEEASTPVDPKRVFSALMKEIDPAQGTRNQTSIMQTPVGDEDVFSSDLRSGLHSSVTRDLRSSASRDLRRSFDSELHDLASHTRLDNSVQSKATIKSNSIKSLSRALRATIRTVTPSGPPSSPLPERAPSVRGLVRVPRPVAIDSAVSTSAGEQHKECDDNTIGSIDFTLPPRNHAIRDGQSGNIVKPSAEQIQNRIMKARGRWKTPLDENNIPILPRQTERAYTVANIASETTLQSCLKEQTPPPALMGTKDVTPVDREPQRAQPYTSPRPRPLFSPLSPSVYSRNTDGLSIMPNDSVMSLDAAVDEDGGSAVIITRRAVKSYIVGTPSPERTVNSTRSSRDWKAWLSHEVSELESMPREDIALQDQYIPHHRHLRELTQISHDVSIADKDKSTGSPSSLQQQGTLETPTNPHGASGRATVMNNSLDSGTSPSSSVDLPTVRRVTERPPLSPMSMPPPKQRRVSSILSEGSSLSQPRPGSRTSQKMNGPFPFIERGRRSSYNSARGSRYSSTESGSSSSKATPNPSPKVYSDFSAPSSDRVSKHAPNTRLKRSEGSDCDKENGRQSSPPSFAERIDGVAASSREKLAAERISHMASASKERLTKPQSFLGPSNLGSDRTSSILNLYASSADQEQPSVNKSEAPLPRIRMRVRPLSPAKLTTRPKSALDLRSSNVPSLSPVKPSMPGSDSPKKRESYHAYSPSIQRKPVTGSALEGDTFRMLLESPWMTSGSPSPSPPPRHGGMEPGPADWMKRPALHLKQSSSTLALNKEPSPGADDRHIDALLGRSGSVTPGQRMAERFIREREAPSGAGSPASLRSGLDRRSATGSPAFV